jgi:chemotaxis protein MotA
MDAHTATASLFDPSALVVVVAGTVLATFARVGWRELVVAIRHAAALPTRGFDPDANRSALARWVRDTHKNGVLGADQPDPPDPLFARALDHLVRTGSITAFERAYQETQTQRRSSARSAASVFEQAGELAPVFGLVGTLFAMTQIVPAVEGEAAATLGAIATAVLSSLYGVLTAHLVFLPLASAVMRRSISESEARENLVHWFCEELGGVASVQSSPGGLAPLKPAPLKPAA